MKYINSPGNKELLKVYYMVLTMIKFTRCPVCGYIWRYGGTSASRVCCPECKRHICGEDNVKAAMATLEEWGDYKARSIIDEASQKLDELIAQVDQLRGEVKP